MRLPLSPKHSSPSSVQRRLADPDPIVRYMLKIPKRKFRAVTNLAQWYRDYLNVKVSAAYLIREAIDEFIARQKRIVDKARRGRFHAKVRNHTDNDQ